jgi:hypothetical protein
MGGYAPRARQDSVHPRRLLGASGRPLDFTVRDIDDGGAETHAARLDCFPRHGRDPRAGYSASQFVDSPRRRLCPLHTDLHRRQLHNSYRLDVAGWRRILSLELASSILAHQPQRSFIRGTMACRTSNGGRRGHRRDTTIPASMMSLTIAWSGP